jgi:hypothetical protein
VAAHVHWLRSRIEDAPSRPVFIHPVRGVGYVFRRPPGATPGGGRSAQGTEPLVPAVGAGTVTGG